MRGEEATTELKTESSKTRHLTTKEVAELDPFKLKTEKAIEKSERVFAGGRRKKQENQPAQSYEQFFQRNHEK